MRAIFGLAAVGCAAGFVALTASILPWYGWVLLTVAAVSGILWNNYKSIAGLFE